MPPARTRLNGKQPRADLIYAAGGTATAEIEHQRQADSTYDFGPLYREGIRTIEYSQSIQSWETWEILRHPKEQFYLGMRENIICAEPFETHQLALEVAEAMMRQDVRCWGPHLVKQYWYTIAIHGRP